MSEDLEENDPSLSIKSRTRKKHEAEEAQVIGERLVNLSSTQLNQLNLPELLLDSINEARTISARGGKKRQLQFIGKLMRDENLDMTEINLLLSQIDSESHSETKAFRQIEKWRDKLLNGGNEVVSEFLQLYSQADTQLLRQHIRNSKNEKNQKLAKKSKKMIFQYIKQLIEDSEG